jgi:hypothetical protein
MKDVEFWYWMMLDQFGRRRKSPCRYRAEDALSRDPTATRVEGSCEVRSCPENSDELAKLAPTNQHLIGQEGRKGCG